VSLIYSMIMSLEGYVEDERGRFGWGLRTTRKCIPI
jgi:hypothetical protein